MTEEDFSGFELDEAEIAAVAGGKGLGIDPNGQK